MKIKIAFLIFVASIMYIVYELNNPISEKQRIYNEAQIEFDKQNYENAIVKYDSCIYVNYNTGLAYFYKGICEIKLNKITEGLNDCKQGYDLVPKLYNKYYDLGLYKYENINSEDNNVNNTDANIVDDVNESSTEKNIDYSVMSAEELNKLGIEQYDKKEYRKALKFYNLAIEKDDKYKVAFYNIGLCYEYLNKFDSAVVVYKKVLKIDSKYKYANYELGYSYYKLSDFDNAIKYYKKYLLVDSKNLSAQNEMALTYYKKGEVKNLKYYKKKACKMWKKYLKEGNAGSQAYLDKYCK